ncbi:MAG: phospho-N-acetylmuramoyl-pentapeptide-transferase [Candidatus Cloacimonetes bacterium]|nr:phospho-N-acetylmuramoyl-pentapeptide-transferase [Candidatus Cloacimonadota bacterium]
MLYHLFSPLVEQSIIFNVFRYVTFRAIAAFITALLFSLFIGPKMIRMLKKGKVVETINEHVPETHQSKNGTPTMGGLIILTALILAVILWNNLTNSYVLIMLLVAFWLGGIGFIDDYLKNMMNYKKGLIARYKLIGQISLSVIVVLAIYLGTSDRQAFTTISVPFFKDFLLPLGWLYFPFVVVMIVGTSNAVNITDGLDGLAGGTLAIAALALGVMAYIKGNVNHSEYLQLNFIREAGELTVFIAAIIGTILGFLWFNSKPAQVFMGDIGSLTLGGIMATLALLLKEEIFFAIVCGVFIMEALSTLIQRYYFKYTRIKTGTGKRVFLCAPLHHHFEKKGIPEEKIVVRFWIIAALFAAIGLATIKLR